ncbi:MAG: LysE family translocator [Acidimicrobiia bacterium]|jgi:threonine/homoserine/homoserine lactone efflux protein
MPDPNTVLAVALASLVLVVIPGPAVIYILTRSVSQGRTAGLVSAVGVNLGSAVHVLAAVAGLSLILASSAYAYSVVKWLGVGYLAWIGYRTLTARDTEFTQPDTQPQSLHRVFTQGVLVNVLNPKVAIFFLAFLPQFVDATSPNPALQTFVLGMTLITIGLLSDSIYAMIGGSLGDLFRRRPGAARATRLTAGFTYLALAGIAAVTGSRAK